MKNIIVQKKYVVTRGNEILFGHNYKKFVPLSEVTDKTHIVFYSNINDAENWILHEGSFEEKINSQEKVDQLQIRETWIAITFGEVSSRKFNYETKEWND